MEGVNEDMTKRLKQSDRGRRNMDKHGMCIYICKYKIVEFNGIDN